MRPNPLIVAALLAVCAVRPALALDFPVASCKSWNGTVVNMDGVDTARATMSGMVTRPDIQEYCQRDPGGETRRSGGKLTTAQCVDNNMREFGRTEMSTTANCQAGTLQFRYGSRPPTQARFPLGADADTSCASGMPPLIAQFKMLCPIAAERMHMD